MAYSQPLGLNLDLDRNAEDQLLAENLMENEQSLSSSDLPSGAAAAASNKVDHSMESFFQRRKSDVMFELRSIQHGERPVTGKGHRDNLQQFMKKHLTVADETAGKENVPSNVDSVEEHRPDSVVVEVQGIVEQRPVSSILQSAAFRRQLENIIRGSIVPTRGQNTDNQRPRVRANNLIVPTNSVQRRAPSIPERRVERPRLERAESTDSLSSQDSFSSARSSADQDLNDVDFEPEASVDQHPSLPSLPTASDEPSPLTARVEAQRRSHLPHLPEDNTRRDSDTGFEGLSWNDIGRVHREELVQELSELVHSRLVSSTLDGEFRATLELLVQDRVQSSGTNGEAVSELVRSLPGRGIPRNDFSHLGIAPLPENDNWDNISVTSISAHSVPYVQTNTYLSREIQSLKGQMQEMKNMLKISVDLQMDIQRAIRQEVAAAFAKSAGQNANAAPAMVSRPVNDTHCLICLDRHSDSVLYQCGHMCVCYICGKDLISRNHTCPVCRAPIKDVIRAYKTNSE